MKTKSNSLCVLLLLCIPFIISAQKALNGVVKIEVFDESGELIETGAGIITGDRGNQVFIVTANHVVDQGSDIQVSFKSRQWDSYKGKLHEQYNEDLDYAVIIVDVPPKSISKHKFRQVDYDALQSGDAVRLIGNPSGEAWTYNTQNIITNPQYGTFETAVSNVGVEPGYSGGALLSKKKNQLIGLIVNVETNNTIAVRMDQILRDLKAWGIPYSFILPYKPPRKKICYVFAALSAGATAASIYFNAEQNRVYDIYSTQMDPDATAYTSIDHPDYVGPRNEALQKAMDNQNKSYYSAGAAGGFALLSVLFSKRKYKNREDGISMILDHIEPVYLGSSVGITYNF